MKNLLRELRSEKGAASVLEATIVLPVVFLCVVLFVFLGFTYAQRAFLQYHSSQLSGYISKTILYPGYQFIQEPFYKSSGSDTVTVEKVSAAMRAKDPYRYLLGLFKDEYTPENANGRGIPEESAESMVEKYLVNHGFMKASGGSLKDPSGQNFSSAKIKRANGFICAVAADTSKVSVYLAQNFKFASFFRMIGMGDKFTVISGQSTSFINDSVEFVRNTDMIFDVANFIAEKLGIDIDKITETISKITGKG